MLRFLPLAVLAAMLAACAPETADPPRMPPHVHYDCVPMLFFAEGSTTLSEAGKSSVVGFLNGKACPVWSHLTPDFSFIVRGYTDKTGSPEENMALSLRRAEAARDFLVSLGISRDRIDVVGYGDTAPLVNKAGPEPQNRRVAISLARDGKEQHYY